MARAEKVEAVREIADRFRASPAALLTEYRGLTVGEIADVRGALRGSDSDYKVLKNTLTKIAVREVGLDELADLLEGPTAVAFVRGDAVEAAKVLDEAVRKYPVLVVKGGVLNGKVIGPDDARELARLESRDVQLAKIVMMVNTPLQQTVNVLGALLRDLGSMVAQVVAQKESEAPAPDESGTGAEGAGGEESAGPAEGAVPTEPDEAEVTDGPPPATVDDETIEQTERAEK